MSRVSLCCLVLLIVGCSSNIQKDPGTVYVVVNNTTGTNNGTSGSNNGTGASNNGANNGQTNNGATNNGATNNGATNNGATNNGATNNGATNNGTTPPQTNNGTVEGDACDNTADLTAVSQTGTPLTARDCMIMCLSESDSRTCTATCLSSELGTSTDCSFCIADLAQCGVDHCFNECIEDPYDPACVACLEPACEADFVACSGIPSR